MNPTRKLPEAGNPTSPNHHPQWAPPGALPGLSGWVGRRLLSRMNLRGTHDHSSGPYPSQSTRNWKPRRCWWKCRILWTILAGPHPQYREGVEVALKVLLFRPPGPLIMEAGTPGKPLRGTDQWMLRPRNCGCTPPMAGRCSSWTGSEPPHTSWCPPGSGWFSLPARWHVDDTTT